MSTNTGKRAGAYSVPQNSFPLPTGSIFSFATLGFRFRKRSRRGNSYSILRHARNIGPEFAPSQGPSSRSRDEAGCVYFKGMENVE